MADFIEIVFILVIVAIVFGARLTPKLADYLARQHHRWTGRHQQDGQDVGDARPGGRAPPDEHTGPET